MSMKETRMISNGGYRGYHSEWTGKEGRGCRAAEMYDKRWQAACEVIDIIAAKVGIDATSQGLYLYQVDWNSETETASSLLADKIDEWLSRSGDKVKLKKKISELESEVEVLKRLLRK